METLSYVDQSTLIITPTLISYDVSSKVEAFVETAITLCKPSRVYVCTGSEQEFTALMQIQIENKTAKLLNPIKVLLLFFRLLPHYDSDYYYDTGLILIVSI